MSLAQLAIKITADSPASGYALRIKLTPISVGMCNGLAAKIIDGLTENEKTAIHPDTKLINTAPLDNMRAQTRLVPLLLFNNQNLLGQLNDWQGRFF